MPLRLQCCIILVSLACRDRKMEGKLFCTPSAVQTNSTKSFTAIRDSADVMLSNALSRVAFRQATAASQPAPSCNPTAMSAAR